MPSGSNSRRTSASPPPRAGRGVTTASSGMSLSASSWRSRDTPVMAVRSALFSATERKDEAA